MAERDQESLPIDRDRPSATQSIQALMIADEMGLLTYRGPVDIRQPAQVAALRAELGRRAVLPEEPGMYYFVYVASELAAADLLRGVVGAAGRFQAAASVLLDKTADTAVVTRARAAVAEVVDDLKAYRKEADRVRQAVLIPEGEARSFALALAVRHGRDAALRLLYMHGVLPV